MTDKIDKENNTERKFHGYGVGVYADDAERVAKVTAFIQETFEGCEDGSYTIREKRPEVGGLCTFGMALQAMKCGKGARRPDIGTIYLSHNVFGCQPRFYQKDGLRHIQPEVQLSVYDMLQEDWEIVD